MLLNIPNDNRRWNNFHVSTLRGVKREHRMWIWAGHVQGKLKHICAWLKSRVESRHVKETFAVRIKVREVNGSDNLSSDVVKKVCSPTSGNGRCRITVHQCLGVQLHCL